PEIGENGHWYINEEDTGKTAQGPTGPPGTTSHSELTDRDAPCSHTIDSIANLRCELEALRCEINNRLAIHCTTEDEFWDSYWNGAIADGLYKWQGHKLAFNQYSTNPPERNPHSMCRALDYAETPEYYFLGNRFDDPSKSYVIALSKKDHSIKKIKFPRLNDKRLVYNQIGAGPGTIVLEPSSGYIYASTPGAILSFDSDEPDNDLNYYVNEARAYTNLVFYNTNTNGAFNSIALVTKEEPLTVVDGGVFAVTKVDSNSPVYYLKNGAIVSKTLDTFNNNLKIPVAGSSTDNYRRYFLNAATDYDGNKLYGLQAVMYNGYNSPVEMHFVSIDINGNPEIIPIPVPTNYNIPPAGNNAFERMYCKNGYVYLDLDTYVTVGTTSQPTRLICVYDTRDGSWTFKEIEDARGIEKKDSYASSNTVYSDGSLVYQRIFPNKSDYIKWDYENNTIQILQTKEALEPSRHKKYLQVDGDNNILNAYKADTSYDLDSNILTYDVINPKDLTMYSYAAPSASMVEQYMTVRKDDGSLFGLGFGYGYGYYHRERVIIDPDGDLALDENGVADASDDLDSYVFSAPLLSNNHYLLEEDGNFMYLSGTPECLNSALVFNDTERTISYSYTSCSPYATAVPVIRLDENGYIYFDDHNRFYTLGVEDTEKSATIGCNTILSKSPTLTGQECVENLTSCSDCQSCGSCPSCQGNCLEECVAAQATINEDSNQ
ncbi:MAG: hypothetical protein FWF59_00635, partial [Turicibacter sp.]|nr:hypothetical protein [Turicibacter sp.]